MRMNEFIKRFCLKCEWKTFLFVTFSSVFNLENVNSFRLNVNTGRLSEQPPRKGDAKRVDYWERWLHRAYIFKCTFDVCITDIEEIDRTFHVYPFCLIILLVEYYLLRLCNILIHRLFGTWINNQFLAGSFGSKFNFTKGISMKNGSFDYSERFLTLRSAISTITSRNWLHRTWLLGSFTLL